MREKVTNVLISNISTVNFRNLEKEYTYGSYRYKGGEMTNIPPIQLLRESLKDQGQLLDYLILMESDQVRGGKVFNAANPASRESFVKAGEACGIGTEADTHHAWLEARLHRDQDADPERFGKMPELKIVNVSDSPSDAEVVASVDNVRRFIESLASEGQLNIYIEANGGVRYVLFMLVNIISTIQKNNSNIELTSIVNMVVSQNPVPVQDVKPVYMSIQLFSAVTEFVNYGRVVSLRDYFSSRPGGGAPDEGNPVRQAIFDCIDKLEIIAEDLQLCRSEFIMDDFYGNPEWGGQGIRDVLEEFREKCPIEHEDPDAKIFNLAVDMILKEYDLIYKNVPEDGNFSKEAQLPEIIRWCLDKDYIQQALTFCSERLPNYLFNVGLIRTSGTFDRLYKKYRRIKGARYEYYYHILVQYFTHDYMEWINGVTLNALTDAVWKRIRKGRRGSEFEKRIRRRPNFNVFHKEKVDYGYVRNNLKYIRENRDGIVDFYAEMISEYVLDCNTWSAVNDWGEKHGLLKVEKPGWPGKEPDYVINDLKDDWFMKKNKTAAAEYILQSREIRGNRFDGLKILYAYSDPADVGDALSRMMEGVNVDKKLIDNLKYRLRFNDYVSYFDEEGLFEGIDKDKLREILIIYYFLKDQRNMSNHASLGSSSRSEALDMNNLKKVIDKLLRKINDAVAEVR